MSMKKINKPPAMEGKGNAKSKGGLSIRRSSDSESERVIPPRKSTTKKKTIISTEVQLDVRETCLQLLLQ